MASNKNPAWLFSPRVVKSFVDAREVSRTRGRPRTLPPVKLPRGGAVNGVEGVRAICSDDGIINGVLSVGRRRLSEADDVARSCSPGREFEVASSSEPPSKVVRRYTPRKVVPILHQLDDPDVRYLAHSKCKVHKARKCHSSEFLIQNRRADDGGQGEEDELRWDDLLFHQPHCSVHATLGRPCSQNG